ncbi:F-box protein [Panicum miliaceum]|uniref:F-box protein n=1 Tax=Panicum miliaceum TaxID=4540 RepID=A0A3L6RJD4_PANMI|nr:F-box protein [Panicum miliaceum]
MAARKDAGGKGKGELNEHLTGRGEARLCRKIEEDDDGSCLLVVWVLLRWKGKGDRRDGCGSARISSSWCRLGPTCPRCGELGVCIGTPTAGGGTSWAAPTKTRGERRVELKHTSSSGSGPGCGLGQLRWQGPNAEGEKYHGYGGGHAAAAGVDFVERLGPDASATVFAALRDPADLARAAAVSRSWRTLVMAVHLSKIQCLRLFPEVSIFTSIEQSATSASSSNNGVNEEDAGSTATATAWENHRREQNV